MTTTTLPQSAPAAPVNGQGLCELRGVSHQFKMPNGNPLHVLANINITIRPNEIVLLLGHSGCGKSTIMRIMAGLIKPTSGEVLYHNKPLTGVNPGTSIVFQSFALYPWMTVMRNVEVVLEAAGKSHLEARGRAEAAIKRVGLAGFEEAYPRELSGGMKQRVGMARALSTDPEILFMDEPFSAVDALVAESLRAAVTDMWADLSTNPTSILMVSHDIKEVAYMADRIIVLSANPGRVRKVVENALPRPRDYRSPAFLRLVDYLHDIITGNELPDPPPTAAPGTPGAPGVAATTATPGTPGTPGAPGTPGVTAATGIPAPGGAPGAPEAKVGGMFEPLPDAGSAEIVGLLEYLHARGGREDVFKIATDTNREFGVVIAVVKAAELLDFVDTPKRMVVLEPDGLRFVTASTDEQKALWREKIVRLGLFKEIRGLIDQQSDHEIERELALETIVFNVPYEDYEKTFRTMINWARYGDLFTYDENTQRLSAL